MKTPPKTLKTFLAASLMILGTCLTASAQLIQVNSGDPTLGVNSVPTATIGAGGYDFFDTQGGPSYPSNLGGIFAATGDVASLPSYVSSVSTQGGQRAAGSDSQIDINGLNYFSGVDYNDIFNNGANSNPLTKIVLTGTVPTFQLGLLADNYSSDGTTLYTLALYNGSTNAQIGSTLTINSTATGNSAANDFYFAQVSDPNPDAGTDGDYLIVSGGSTAYDHSNSDVETINLGGVTFDVATTPEPSTFVLFGLGALGLVLISRRAMLRM